MANNCSTCDHPKRREIDSRLRDGTRLTDISLWLKEQGTPITRQALARHQQKHLGLVAPHGGKRATSGDFLRDVVDTAAEGLADGTLAVTLKDGIAAQKALDSRAARDQDRDLFARIAIALTGGGNVVRVIDPEVEALEASFRPMLTAGDE